MREVSRAIPKRILVCGPDIIVTNWCKKMKFCTQVTRVCICEQTHLLENISQFVTYLQNQYFSVACNRIRSYGYRGTINCFRLIFLSLLKRTERRKKNVFNRSQTTYIFIFCLLLTRRLFLVLLLLSMPCLNFNLRKENVIVATYNPINPNIERLQVFYSFILFL